MNLCILILVMNEKYRRWLLLISISAIIGFLIILSFSISEVSEQSALSWYRPLISGLRGPRPIPVHILLILSVLLIVSTVPMSYYFMSQKLEEKLEKNMRLFVKLIKKNNLIPDKSLIKIDSKNIILKFLNSGERKVLEKLIERKGEVLQSEISRAKGMTKLNTHRAVKDLKRKGVIEVQPYGKTNRIILAKEVKDIILK